MFRCVYVHILFNVYTHIFLRMCIYFFNCLYVLYFNLRLRPPFQSCWSLFSSSLDSVIPRASLVLSKTVNGDGVTCLSLRLSFPAKRNWLHYKLSPVLLRTSCALRAKVADCIILLTDDEPRSSSFTPTFRLWHGVVINLLGSYWRQKIVRGRMRNNAVFHCCLKKKW